MKVTKKLIEVALPLEAINKASAHEKMPGIGAHPRGLHLWWARRPLAAARAVIFSQMVDDPSEYTDVLLSDPQKKRAAQSELKKRLKHWESLPDDGKRGEKPTLQQVIADQERQRLFRIIEDLVQWENTTNETVLQAARDEIWQSWRRACALNADHPRAKELFDRNKLPAFHDPFAGGGALPLEAQRLGLEAYASDLNPVAVLINKAMIEIPPKFAGRPPVNPESRKSGLFDREWNGAQGLAEDVRYYGKWMRDEAEKRIGHLYPKVEVTAEMAKERPDLKQYVGRKLTVIAWIWARTVKSPNPAYAHVDVPLASTFMLSTKPGKEAYVEPVIIADGYSLKVKQGKPRDAEAAKRGTKLARGANFACLMSNIPIKGDYIKAAGMAGQLGSRLMAVVAEGEHTRVYLPPVIEHELGSQLAPSLDIIEKIHVHLANDPRNLWCLQYGLSHFDDLFTPRQLTTLSALSDLVSEVRALVDAAVEASFRSPDRVEPSITPTQMQGYSSAVSTYLAFALDRCTDFSNSCTRWVPGNQKVMNLFSKQAIGMTWDYPEANLLGEVVGGFFPAVDFIAKCILKLPQWPTAHAKQSNAIESGVELDAIVSTDPPYYDNIGYSDLSDFFYVWLRRSVGALYPTLFSTLVAPKENELIASPYRLGSKQKAESFFLEGMSKALSKSVNRAHPAFPVTIYYAFKQTEGDSEDGIRNTGWDTFLGALLNSGFSITGTWPLRSEQANRMIGLGTNALATSIVLVCRPREKDAKSVSRREFVNALKSELPAALALLQRGNIAPVDLAQAAIGPGMAVYTRYAAVLDAETGKPLTVRDALALINQTLDEALSEQEGDFDADSRWALTWFEQAGFEEGEFGVAEQLSKSKNTSVSGLVEARILKSARGKVRLLRPEELPADWDPETDDRLTTWEMVHHLIRVLQGDGEGAAAALVAKLGTEAEVARELCYRLYTICERKKRNAEAFSYNALVQSWPEILRLSREAEAPRAKEADLFGEEGE